MRSGAIPGPVADTHIQFLLLQVFAFGKLHQHGGQAVCQHHDNGKKLHGAGAGFRQFKDGNIDHRELDDEILVRRKSSLIGDVRQELVPLRRSRLGQSVQSLRMEAGELHQTGFTGDQFAIDQALGAAGTSVM